MSAFRRNARNLLLLIIPLVVYSIFWFISAPDPRYFGSTMWIFAICPALTFAAGGLRMGLASTLASLGAAAIPISLLSWEFRWAWTYAEERLPTFTRARNAACDKSARCGRLDESLWHSNLRFAVAQFLETEAFPRAVESG